MSALAMSESGIRLIIVEDDPFIASDLHLSASAAGYDVVGVAVDTDTALSLSATHRPDLALLDINLSDGRTGVDICRRLVAEFGVRAVFLTGNPEQAPPDLAGAVALLEKPYSPRTLTQAFNILEGEAPREIDRAAWADVIPDLERCETSPRPT